MNTIRKAIMIAVAGSSIGASNSNMNVGEQSKKKPAELRQQARIVIVTSHHPDVLQAVASGFTDHYQRSQNKVVRVSWINQGGTSRNRRFVMEKAASHQSNWGIDVVWGGGEYNLQSLRQDGLLRPMALSKDVQSDLKALQELGVNSAAQDKTWAATSLSAFGLLVDLSRYEMPPLAPGSQVTTTQLREDLLSPVGSLPKVAAQDPRYSSTFAEAVRQMVSIHGWPETAEYLARLYRPGAQVALRSEDAVDDVLKGKQHAAFSIDYLARGVAQQQVGRRFRFLPLAEPTMLVSDPIGIVKGASEPELAQAFVDYILSVEGQKLLNGQAEGLAGLARISVRRDVAGLPLSTASDVNPFSYAQNAQVNAVRASIHAQVLADVVGRLFIDLRADWASRQNALSPSSVTGRLAQPVESLRAGSVLAAKPHGITASVPLPSLREIQDLSRQAEQGKAAEVERVLIEWQTRVKGALSGATPRH